MVMIKNLSAVFVLAQVLAANAHLSIWTPAMFGFDPKNINSANASDPLEGLRFQDW